MWSSSQMDTCRDSQKHASKWRKPGWKEKKLKGKQRKLQVKKMEVIINAARVIASAAISLIVTVQGIFSPLICAYLVREHLK